MLDPSWLVVVVALLLVICGIAEVIAALTVKTDEGGEEVQRFLALRGRMPKAEPELWERVAIVEFIVIVSFGVLTTLCAW